MPRQAAEAAAKAAKKAVKKDAKMTVKKAAAGEPPEAEEQPAASSEGRSTSVKEEHIDVVSKAATKKQVKKAARTVESEQPKPSSKKARTAEPEESEESEESEPAESEELEESESESEVVPLPQRVYVGHCPPNLNEARLRATFASCGVVSAVEMIVEKKKFKGTCFVTFAAVGSVPAALKLNGTELDGSTLVVKVATPKAAKVPRSKRPAALAVAALHASIAEKSGRGTKRKDGGEGGGGGGGGEGGEAPKKKTHSRGNKAGNRAGHAARPAKVRKRSDAAIVKAAAAGKVLY